MSQVSQLTRRRFCLCCVASATFASGGGWLTPRAAYAEARNIVDMIRADAATASIKVHKLRGGVSVLEGSGGSVGVLSGPDGKVMIDAGITASKPRMLEALASLGSEPVRHLINTHWHFDHADGNEWVQAQGAAITAHENTRKHLKTMQRVEDWNFDFPALAPSAIPTDVFSERKRLTVNRSTIELQYYGPAHTDSDISVHFVEADILHVADTFWNGIYPFIDYSTGGSIDGMIRAAEANLAKAGDKTIVIAGHGVPISNRAELQDYRDMLVAIRDNVARLKKQEKTLDAVVAARPTAAFDGKWGQFVITPALFTKLVYEGV
ncbi:MULTISPECIES: MBL fold metallo-hydrolase [Bradyrhizobium]|jgi:glyoxylase-like metal-dependent hydrolase (beta-lactamase superfamily II)|uniref:MBL fold metallo-hydrolase n=1 Tax=Bradyrhizobium TaxID=374 RepID=UPI0020236DE0|nr:MULTISPECIES: MBL fold metallo-hydrolase [Bradyrhizobium]MCL8483945.1 MBL fold metallo-hydrolase [Bradyrhizobium denitrificans]